MNKFKYSIFLIAIVSALTLSGQAVNITSYYQNLVQQGTNRNDAFNHSLKAYGVTEHLQEMQPWLHIIPTEKDAEVLIKLHVLYARQMTSNYRYRNALRSLSRAKNNAEDEFQHWMPPILLIYAQISTITNNPTRALTYLDQAFQYPATDDTVLHRGHYHISYAKNYCLLNKFEEARQHLNKATAYLKTSDNKKGIRAWHYTNGELQYKKGEYRESITSFKNAWSSSPENYYQGHTPAKVYQYIGNAYYHLDHLDSALANISFAIDAARSTSEAQTYSETLLKKAKIYEQQSQPAKALETIEQFRRAKDELAQKRQKRQRKLLKSKGTTFEELLEEVNELERKNEIHDKYLKTQQIIQGIMILGILFGIVITAFLFYSLKRMRNLNDLLAIKNRHIKVINEKILQQEKMAVIGQLSSAISHEINSPLGVIRASAEHLIEGVEEDILNITVDTEVYDEEAHAYVLDVIHKNFKGTKPLLSTREERKLIKQLKADLIASDIANKDKIFELLLTSKIYVIDEPLWRLLARKKNVALFLVISTIIKWLSAVSNMYRAVIMTDKVTNSMRTYTYGSDLEVMKEVNLSENVATVLDMYELVAKRGITITRDLGHQIMIHGYPEQLRQLWTNLITNAFHAIENIGTLTVTIEELPTTVRVHFEDTGVGVPEEIKQKIFDPLFTTKQRGEGSGLGLDIAKSIVANHHGNITLDTKSDNTKFTITLPRVQDEQ